MHMPSVHWENKLHHSPSKSLILANTHDSNRSHIFLQKLFILNMENEHLLFKHSHCLFFPSAHKKALCNKKWSNSPKPYLSESSFYLTSNPLLDTGKFFKGCKSQRYSWGRILVCKDYLFEVCHLVMGLDPTGKRTVTEESIRK